MSNGTGNSFDYQKPAGADPSEPNAAEFLNGSLFIERDPQSELAGRLQTLKTLLGKAGLEVPEELISLSKIPAGTEKIPEIREMIVSDVVPLIDELLTGLDGKNSEFTLPAVTAQITLVFAMLQDDIGRMTKL